jgi:hypothetical protein
MGGAALTKRNIMEINDLIFLRKKKCFSKKL